MSKVFSSFDFTNGPIRLQQVFRDVMHLEFDVNDLVEISLPCNYRGVHQMELKFDGTIDGECPLTIYDVAEATVEAMKVLVPNLEDLTGFTTEALLKT